MKRVIEYSPQDTEALVERGIVYFKLGQVTEAILDWHQVLSIQPEHQMAKKFLSICVVDSKDH